MGLKDLIDRIKLSFCCKSKCSINEANEFIDDLQDIVEDVVEAVAVGAESNKDKHDTRVNKQYNYYSKKKSNI
tara:strand:+ start:1986 stop:2204 length:219 start_codon:yes stop_codon:yes gene_type:complete